MSTQNEERVNSHTGMGVFEHQIVNYLGVLGRGGDKRDWRVKLSMHTLSRKRRPEKLQTDSPRWLS